MKTLVMTARGVHCAAKAYLLQAELGPNLALTDELTGRLQPPRFMASADALKIGPTYGRGIVVLFNGH